MLVLSVHQPGNGTPGVMEGKKRGLYCRLLYTFIVNQRWKMKQGTTELKETHLYKSDGMISEKNSNPHHNEKETEELVTMVLFITKEYLSGIMENRLFIVLQNS